MNCNKNIQKKFFPCYLIGPTGPKGKDGNGINILDKYDSYEELIKNHPTGNTNDAYIVNGDLYIWKDEENTWKNVGPIQGPKGEKGDKGDPGPSSIRSAYLVTYNDITSQDGIKIESENRLPIKRCELDLTNLITLNTNNTINFNTAGYYKITIIISAYPKKENENTFDKTKDFVTLGLREINTDNIYIGASLWYENEIAKQVIAEGMLSVPDPKKEYEIINLGNQTIYLISPDLNNIKSKSYFTNSLLTIFIEYLGRQI